MKQSFRGNDDNLAMTHMGVGFGEDLTISFNAADYPGCMVKICQEIGAGQSRPLRGALNDRKTQEIGSESGVISRSKSTPGLNLPPNGIFT